MASSPCASSLRTTPAQSSSAEPPPGSAPATRLHPPIYREIQHQGGREPPASFHRAQPSWLAVPAPGVSADVHLGSILTSLARGYLQSDNAKGIENVMLLTKKVPPLERRKRRVGSFA